MAKKPGNGYANEDQFQAAAFQWTWNTFMEMRRLFFHPANEGEKNIVKATSDRSKGLVPGTADLVFQHPSFVIELKQPGEKQTVAQKEYEAALDRVGIPYFLVEYMEEYQRIVTRQFATVGVFPTEAIKRF